METMETVELGEHKPGRQKLPAEAVELYNLFIHGAISRRAFGDGIKKLGISVKDYNIN